MGAETHAQPTQERETREWVRNCSWKHISFFSSSSSGKRKERGGPVGERAAGGRMVQYSIAEKRGRKKAWPFVYRVTIETRRT